MNLHDRIMNITVRSMLDHGEMEDGFYQDGHRDARHAAAELAIEADTVLAVAFKQAAGQAAQIREQRELITQLNAALEDLLEDHVYTDRFVYPDHDPEDSSLVKRARAALSAVREYSNG